MSTLTFFALVAALWVGCGGFVGSLVWENRESVFAPRVSMRTILLLAVGLIAAYGLTRL